jgi:hypothetical protein
MFASGVAGAGGAPAHIDTPVERCRDGVDSQGAEEASIRAQVGETITSMDAGLIAY